VPPASLFLLFGLALAVVLSVGAWLIRRPPRSPVYSVDEFRRSLRAMAPTDRR
jgi:hypothetical protein